MKFKLSNFKKNILLLIFALLFSLLLLEGTVYFLTKRKMISIDEPGYSLDVVRHRFWADIDPVFGTWHENFAKHHLKKSCIDVQYEANSYGARDVERSKQSKHPRVVVLGDSFIEGYGVADPKRMTNLLERSTGVEHLNFGTSGGFGPTQYYLLYKTLAKKFSHDMVMIGILPFNDFFDDDLEFGKKAYSGRYRPYFVGEYPDYQLIYYNKKNIEESKSQLERFTREIRGFLRGYTYTYNALDRLWNVFLVHRAMPDQKVFSGFYDYKPEQFNRLKFSIEKILKEAKGKKIVIFTIPVLADFNQYRQKGEAPLSKALKEFALKHSLLYIDLLPAMHDFTSSQSEYFLTCDNHWNEFGNQVAAQILKEKIILYRLWKNQN